MRKSIMFALMLAACATTPPKSQGPGSGSGSDGSGSNGSGSGSDPNGLTPQTFIEQLVTQDCQHAWSCMAQYPTTATTTFASDWGSSQTDCVQQDDDYNMRDEIAAAVTAGHITWDPQAAHACLANMGFPAACTDFFNTYDYPDACYNALSGNIADGGACTTDWECSGDTSVCTAGKCAPDTTGM